MMPNMIYCRARHASCAVGPNTVYVFAGIDITQRVVGWCHTSIEKLDVRNQQTGWQCLDLPHGLLPMSRLGVCAINEKDILIFCGKFQKLTTDAK